MPASSDPPTIDQIPQASQLQQQLATLNTAIAIVNAGGSVNAVTVAQPATSGMSMQTGVTLNPPVDDPAVLDALASALQKQADAVTALLAQMGYAPSARRK